MKFTIASITLFACANALVASPVERSPPTLVERDLATATSVLADVKNGFDALQKAAAAFNGDPTELKNTASALLAKIDSDTTAINNMTPLTVSECLSLIGPTDALQKQGEALAQQLESRIADVEKAKQCATVRDFLGKGVDESKALITALVNKVPTAVQGIVKDKGGKVTKTLQDAQAAFSEDKCKDN